MITDRTGFQFSTQTLFEITGQLSAIADHINEVLGEGIDKAYKAGIKAVVTNNIKWLKGSKDKPAFNKFAEDLDITVDPKTGKVVTIKKKKKPLNPLFDVSYTETDMKAIYNFRVEAFTVAQIGEYDLQEDLKGLAEKTVLEHNSDPSYFVKEAQRMANRYIRGDWLETNFNTAVGSSYRAAEWIRLQDPAVKDIYPAYQYKTRGDSRVRDEHRALADKVYRNTDPLWSKVWPPNGWNCRCYAIPLDTDDLSSGQYKVEDMMRSKEEEKAIIDATFQTPKEKKYFARNSGEVKSIWGKWINEKFKDMPADVKAEIKAKVKEYVRDINELPINVHGNAPKIAQSDNGINKDNFYKLTKTDFEIDEETMELLVDLPITDDRPDSVIQLTNDKWKNLKDKYKNEYISKSGSSYIYTPDGVYRKADHWSDVSSCTWQIVSTKYQTVLSGRDPYVIGFAKFSDFIKKVDRQDWKTASLSWGDLIDLKEKLKK